MRIVVCPARGRAQLGTDASGELSDRERLDQVVDGAAVEPGDPVLDLAAGGQHDHRQLGPLCVNAAQNLHPAQPRQHQIEHDELDVGFQRTVEPGLAVACGDHLEPVASQAPLDEVDDPRLVLNHQDHGGIIRFGLEAAIPLRRDYETFLTALSGRL